MNKTRYFIINVRRALMMTQDDFAEAIGRSPRTVRRWEAGETEGTITDAIAIMKLCKDSGVDLDDIVFFCFCDRLGLQGLFFIIIIKSRKEDKRK